MNIILKIFWGITVLVFLFLLFYAHSIMDGMIAIHFDLNMKPDRYLDRDTYFYSILGTIILINLVLIGLIRLMPMLPASLISMPNKEFWLSDKDHSEKFWELMTRTIWGTAIFVNTVLIIAQLMILDFNASAYDAPFQYSYLVVTAICLYLIFFVAFIARFFIKRLDIVEVRRYSGGR